MVLRGGTAAETTSVLLTKHLRTVPCLRYRSSHQCGDLDPFWTIGPTSVDFSSHRVLTVSGKCIGMVHSPSHGRRMVYVPPINVAITKTWLHLDFVDSNNRWSKHDDYDRHTSIKERPANYSYGTPKRRISEVMSDHSLSS